MVRARRTRALLASAAAVPLSAVLVTAVPAQTLPARPSALSGSVRPRSKAPWSSGARSTRTIRPDR